MHCIFPGSKCIAEYRDHIEGIKHDDLLVNSKRLCRIVSNAETEQAPHPFWKVFHPSWLGAGKHQEQRWNYDCLSQACGELTAYVFMISHMCTIYSILDSH